MLPLLVILVLTPTLQIETFAHASGTWLDALNAQLRDYYADRAYTQPGETLQVISRLDSCCRSLLCGCEQGNPFWNSDIDVFVIARNEDEYRAKLKLLYEKVIRFRAL